MGIPANQRTDLPGVTRPLFPALGQLGPACRPWVHLDGPGGTQVPSSVAAAISEAILFSNANRGAPFQASLRVEAIMRQAAFDCASLLGVDGPDRIVFGPNMTTLAFHLADAIIPTMSPGDEVLVSNLDHDANVAPWVHAANRSGARIRRLDFCRESMTLSPMSLAGQVGPRTKWVAFTAASNALGSLTPVKELVRAARTTGAMVAVDGTHLAPHILPRVDEWDPDFFFCSAYKFFGPHVGIMTGKRHLLESLMPAKVRPAPEALPIRWMTGTQNHEGIAGLSAAIRYMASLAEVGSDTRERLSNSYGLISAHEETLMRAFTGRVSRQSDWRVVGIAEPDPHRRVATFALRGPVPPAIASRRLAEEGICAYAGNFYALSVTEALGIEREGGLLRIGAMHYNTEEEIHRFWDVLEALS